ncbi:HEAT repeat domain-containing protein [Coralliovum pocilloporae]|uniref:HEAT repeat domain-containing protein n=1 Tax=Coralliovum pocilloporae TaxID=3066369 RepID=UPI003306EF99
MFHISLENDLRFARSERFKSTTQQILVKLSENFWNNKSLKSCTFDDLDFFKSAFVSEDSEIWTRAATAITRLAQDNESCRQLWLSLAVSPDTETRVKVAEKFIFSPPDLIEQICRTLSTDADVRVRSELVKALKDNGDPLALPIIKDAQASETDPMMRRKWGAVFRHIHRYFTPQKSFEIFKWDKIGQLLLDDSCELLKAFGDQVPDVEPRAIILDCNPPYGEVLITIGTAADIKSEPTRWDVGNWEFFDLETTLSSRKKRYFKKWSRQGSRISELMHETEFALGENPEEDFMLMAAGVAKLLEKSVTVRNFSRGAELMVLAVSHDESINTAIERRRAV